MGEVIDLNAQKPHLSGQALCTSCHHTWPAVAPLGVAQLACPECATMNGVWMNPVGVPPGLEVKTCPCGGQVFFVSRKAHHCVKCGLEHPY